MERSLEQSVDQAERNGGNERKAILQSLFRGLISIQLAAERLASMSLKEPDIEGSLLRTWHAILEDAKETADHHEQLSELVVTISHLPPAKDEEGNQLTLYDLRIWDDLPGFAITLYDDWRHYSHQQTQVSIFVNINKVAAQLACIPKSIFTGTRSFRIWALWLMRGALEYPGVDRELEPLETYLPAAVAWVSLLGEEIFSWDNEFPSGEREGETLEEEDPYGTDNMGFVKNAGSFGSKDLSSFHRRTSLVKS